MTRSDEQQHGVGRTLSAINRRILTSVKAVFTVVSVVLTFVGVPSIREDISDWGKIFSFLGSTFSAYAFPTLGFLGLAVVGVLLFAERQERRGGRSLPAASAKPSARLALAEQCEQAAADLRALCVKWSGRGGGGVVAYSERQDKIDETQRAALAEYERENSIAVRQVFDAAVEQGVLPDAERNPVETPRFTDDLREVAGQRLRVIEPELKSGIDDLLGELRYLRDELQKEAAVPVGNIDRIDINDDNFDRVNGDAAAS